MAIIALKFKIRFHLSRVSTPMKLQHIFFLLFYREKKRMPNEVSYFMYSAFATAFYLSMSHEIPQEEDHSQTRIHKRVHTQTQIRKHVENVTLPVIDDSMPYRSFNKSVLCNQRWNRWLASCWYWWCCHCRCYWCCSIFSPSLLFCFFLLLLLCVAWTRHCSRWRWFKESGSARHESCSIRYMYTFTD